MGSLHFSKLYAIAAVAGIIGVIVRGFNARSIFAALFPRAPECFGPGFL